MLKVKQPILVEGKYDHIRLSSVVDAPIFETGGFRIFKDKEMLAALRQVAKTTGIIVLTDSDDAGFRIRSYVKSALGPTAKITHVYVPSIPGKEKRKLHPSAEGLLGVEGMDAETLLEAFRKAGVGCDHVEMKFAFTTADLFALGLSGTPDSAERRRRVLAALGLPQRMSTKTMLSMLSMLCGEQELAALAATLDETPRSQNFLDEV